MVLDSESNTSIGIVKEDQSPDDNTDDESNDFDEDVDEDFKEPEALTHLHYLSTQTSENSFYSLFEQMTQESDELFSPPELM